MTHHNEESFFMEEAGGGVTTLFHDTFTDTGTVALQEHIPEIGGPWVIESGGMNVAGGIVFPTAFSNVYIESGESDIYILSSQTRNMGIRFRVVDDLNFLYMWPSGIASSHNVVIYKVVAGVTTQIALADAGWSDTDLGLNNMEVQAYGNDIKCKMTNPANPAEFVLATVTNSMFNTATKHGLRGHGSFLTSNCTEILCRTTDGTDL